MPHNKAHSMSSRAADALALMRDKVANLRVRSDATRAMGLVRDTKAFSLSSDGTTSSMSDAQKREQRARNSAKLAEEAAYLAEMPLLAAPAGADPRVAELEAQLRAERTRHGEATAGLQARVTEHESAAAALQERLATAGETARALRERADKLQEAASEKAEAADTQLQLRAAAEAQAAADDARDVAAVAAADVSKEVKVLRGALKGLSGALRTRTEAFCKFYECEATESLPECLMRGRRENTRSVQDTQIAARLIRKQKIGKLRCNLEPLAQVVPKLSFEGVPASLDAPVAALPAGSARTKQRAMAHEAFCAKYACKDQIRPLACLEAKKKSMSPPVYEAAAKELAEMGKTVGTRKCSALPRGRRR